MSDQYDVVVIGAGPAGRTAAVLLARRGLRAACIDEHAEPGGTCLHEGVIAMRAMLAAVQSGAADVSAVAAWRDRVVGAIARDLDGRLTDAGVTLLKGRARLHAAREVRFQPAGRKRSRSLTADYVILAPGAAPLEVPGIVFDDERIVDASRGMRFTEPPVRLCVIGAGVIGLEIACLWAALGSRVTLVDARAEFLPAVDGDIAVEAMRRFTQQGLDIRLATRCIAAARERNEVVVEVESGGKRGRIVCDRVIVAAGRRPATEGIADAGAGLLFAERCEIGVDESCRTNLPNVYAIGDAVRGPMHAHKGIEEAVHVAELIAGHNPPPLRLDGIPSVVHARPEIAWVGTSEAQARASGIPVRSGMAEYISLEPGSAGAPGDILAKLVVHAETDRLLGVHVLGTQAGQIVAAGLVALELGASGEDLALMPFPYPGGADVLRKAALAIA